LLYSSIRRVLGWSEPPLDPPVAMYAQHAIYYWQALHMRKKPIKTLCIQGVSELMGHPNVIGYSVRIIRQINDHTSSNRDRSNDSCTTNVIEYINSIHAIDKWQMRYLEGVLQKSIKTRLFDLSDWASIICLVGQI
jgi:hypothetical protein